MRRLIINYRINKYYNSLPFENRPNPTCDQPFRRRATQPIENNVLTDHGLYPFGIYETDEFVLFYDILLMFQGGASDTEIDQMIGWQSKKMRFDSGRSVIGSLLAAVFFPIFIIWRKRLDKKILHMHDKYLHGKG